MSVSTTRTHIRMHHINSIHTCSMLASNTHASHQQPSLLLICFCYQRLQTNPPSTPPFLSSHSHTTTHVVDMDVLSFLNDMWELNKTFQVPTPFVCATSFKTKLLINWWWCCALKRLSIVNTRSKIFPSSAFTVHSKCMKNCHLDETIFIEGIPVHVLPSPVNVLKHWHL